GRRHVNVVRPGKVVVFRCAQEAEPVGRHSSTPSAKISPLFSVCAWRILKISSCLRMPVAPSTPRSLPSWVSWEICISLSARMSRASTAVPPFSTGIWVDDLAMSFLVGSFSSCTRARFQMGHDRAPEFLHPFSRVRRNRDEGGLVAQAHRPPNPAQHACPFSTRHTVDLGRRHGQCNAQTGQILV